MSGGKYKDAIDTIYPVVAFVVLSSIFVHGLSTGFISVYGHFTRHERDRASMIGQERDLLDGFVGSDYGSSHGTRD